MGLSRHAVCRALHSRWRIIVALLCGAALVLRVQRTAQLAADFPHHSPTKLAHFLADFTNHPRLYTHITGSWWIDEEVSNASSWRYAVVYECGARCAGRVQLAARLDAGAHHVRLLDTRCYWLPILSWPQICENLETETIITARRGGGAHLEERAATQCGLLARAACDLRAARRDHLRALRDALAQELLL